MIMVANGCAPVIFKYEKPDDDDYHSSGVFSKNNQTGCVAVVNPISFPQIPKLADWQQKIAGEIQNEFISRLRNSGIFMRVAPADSQYSSIQNVIVFNISLKDKCIYYPYWYGFVGGERERYFLDCTVDISQNKKALAQFKFSDSNSRVQGMWFIDLFIPMFPVVIRKDGKAVPQTTAGMFRNFDSFVLKNTAAFQSLPATVNPADSSSPSIPPAAGFVSAPAETHLAEDLESDLEWQRFRKPPTFVHSAGLGIGYGYDFASSRSFQNAVNTDMDFSEGGIALGLDYTFAVLPYIDQLRYKAGHNSYKYRRLSPEIFCLLNFSQFSKTASIHYGTGTTTRTDDSSRTYNDLGGHTSVQAFLGPRLVVQTMKHVAVFGQAGIGINYEYINHRFNTTMVPGVRQSNINGAMAFGGGLRILPFDYKIQVELAYNAIYRLSNLNPSYYYVNTYGLRVKYNFGDLK
jgi:hypothetical protein